MFIDKLKAVAFNPIGFNDRRILDLYWENYTVESWRTWQHQLMNYS